MQERKLTRHEQRVKAILTEDEFNAWDFFINHNIVCDEITLSYMSDTGIDTLEELRVFIKRIVSKVAGAYPNGVDEQLSLKL